MTAYIDYMATCVLGDPEERSTYVLIGPRLASYRIMMNSNGHKYVTRVIFIPKNRLVSGTVWLSRSTSRVSDVAVRDWLGLGDVRACLGPVWTFVFTERSVNRLLRSVPCLSTR